MSKDNVIVTGEDVVVTEEDVIVTGGDEVIEEDVVVTIETEEPKAKTGKKKILKAVFAGSLMLLAAMMIFSAGFYTGSHAGGSSGGRSKGHQFVNEKVEPIIIETEEGFQNITTLPHVLTEEDNLTETKNKGTREANENDTKDIKWDRTEDAGKDDIIQPIGE